MKNKESQNEEFNEVITLNVTDNQSISQAPEIKAPQSSNKKAKKLKKNNFNVPINKKNANTNLNLNTNANPAVNTNNNNFNINISFSDSKPKNSSLIEMPMPLTIPIPPQSTPVDDNQLVSAFKELKAQYKTVKQELEANPNDEAKSKLKKRIKKKMKQIKEALGA